MPYFVYRCYDAPGMGEVRDRLRPAHREHLRNVALGVEALAGGRLTSDDGTRVIGTMIIVSAESRAQVAQFMEADPYMQGGIFGRTEIERWDWGLGLPAAAAGTQGAGG
jgi:uncharacterized protein YciI